MPLVQMPDGTYADFPDGTPPEVIARVRQQHPARSGTSDGVVHPAPTQVRSFDRRSLLEAAQNGSVSDAEMQAAVRSGVVAQSDLDFIRKEAGRMPRSGFSALTSGVEHALTFGMDDEIAGAVGGVTGHGYDASRDAALRRREQDFNEHPVASVVGNIAGTVVNPLGTGATALQGAGRVVPALGRIGAAIERAPVPVQAALAGFNQGVAQGFGNADHGDRFGGALTGGVEGGIGGLAFGTLLHGVRRGWQTLRDTRPEQAGRLAYGRIADALEGAAPRAEYGPNIDPALLAQRELAATRAGGTDGMVADLSPGLQAMAARVARRPELPASNQMIARTEERAAQRPGAMENQIQQRFDDVGTGTDATAAQAANTGARRAHGQANYDDVLDRPMQWSPELEQWAKGAGPTTQKAIRKAYDIMLDERLNPAELGFSGKDSTFTHVPNMRTFDYIKRGFDSEIGQAVRAGDRNTARILSGELDGLKQGLGNANKDYLAVLATQRDFFQRDTALELGRSAVSRLAGARADPRKLLAEIQQVKPEDFEMVRTGFADKLLALRDTQTGGRGPVAVLQAMLKSPNQRRVLEALFDGKGNLGRFERWLGREVRSSKTDQMVSGPQSITSLMQGAAEPTGAAGVGGAALRGYGFGGLVGGTSNALRAVTDLAKNATTTRAVQEQLARILMGDGEGLVAGVHGARNFNLERTARNRRAGVGTAKGIADILTGGM